MLIHLQIKNIAVIDAVDISFGEGFNVFTGETGAGKSIIIEAINLLLGERASRELIRTGESKAVVSASFFLADISILSGMGIEAEDGNLIITREIYADGRGICKINNSLVPTATLKELGKSMVNIHGLFQKMLTTKMVVGNLSSSS